MQPLPELAELREAVYVGGKKVLSDDYLKRLTPLSLAIWYMDDGGFTLRSKGLQERTEGGSGRSEICVEAMSTDDTRSASARLPGRHLGHRREADRSAGARQRPSWSFPKDETAKLHALIAPFVHPSMAVQAAAAVPGSVRGRAGLRSRRDRSWCRMPITTIARQAADPDACTASTSRWRAPTTTSSTA